MDAGPELDALIAEKVIGLPRQAGVEIAAGLAWIAAPIGVLSGSPFLLLDGREGHVIPSYSTDRAAARQVIEQLKVRDGAICIDVKSVSGGYEATASFYDPRAQNCTGTITAVRKTAPHTICLAALKAVDSIGRR